MAKGETNDQDLLLLLLLIILGDQEERERQEQEMEEKGLLGVGLRVGAAAVKHFMKI